MKNAKPSNRQKSRKVALFGILSAEALALSFLESLLPDFIPLPASKAGFSNIVTMFSVSSLGFSYGFAITLFKAVFALITRGLTAFALSFTGGILSLIIMTLLFKIPENKISFTGLGIVSSVFHNAGQLIASYIILGKYVLGLAPYLFVTAVITGALTGTIYKYTVGLFNKQKKSVINTHKE